MGVGEGGGGGGGGGGWLVGWGGGIIRPATRESPFFFVAVVMESIIRIGTRAQGDRGVGGGVVGEGDWRGVKGHRLDKGDSQSTHASDIMRAGSLCG